MESWIGGVRWGLPVCRWESAEEGKFLHKATVLYGEEELVSPWGPNSALSHVKHEERGGGAQGKNPHPPLLFAVLATMFGAVGVLVSTLHRQIQKACWNRTHFQKSPKIHSRLSNSTSVSHGHSGY